MKRKNMLSIVTIVLVGIFLMGAAGIASAHSLFMVTEDKPAIPAVTSVKQEVMIFYGHPDAPETLCIYKPMRNATLHKPDGSTVDLNLKEGDNCWIAEIILDQKGDYFVTAEREPATYNPIMHGGPDKPQLNHGYIKVVIHAGVEENWYKVIGQEIEIVPLVNPYDLHVGDTFKAQLLYDGKPVKGEYDAAHENESIHDPEEAQIGETDEDGVFSVEINKPGMWLIQGAYNIDEPGTWIATFTHRKYPGVGLFKEGDKISYDSVNYKNTMTLLVSANSDPRVENLEQKIKHLEDSHHQAESELEQLKGKAVTPALAYTAIGISTVAIILAVVLLLVTRKKR